MMRWCCEVKTVCCTCYFAVDYVTGLRHTSVTPALIPSPPSSAESASNLLALHLFLISLSISVVLVIISAVLVYVRCVRGRRRRSPPVKRSVVVPAKQSPETVALALTPAPPSREESTDAAATTAAGSYKHVYAPSAHCQQPFNGFLPTRETPEVEPDNPV